MSARASKRVSAPEARQVRVAIYTRKSTEDGLDQQFNTLDAQREAVEAYVTSQRGEGWVALPDRFDDGGFTGANIERPAFQRLLQDIEAGKIDLVAVYKIDRLSRSIADFVHVMDMLKERGVGFVSITQSFDTSTSSGRLMLNILVSFGVYERELIAERTRDKMAASRRKGMWTGGSLVLGYDVVDRKLVINASEAAQVTAIFAAFEETGSLMATVRELARRGWTTKSWTGREGQRIDGKAFNKHTLRSLLTNPIYAGLMRYKDEVHQGQHAAIIDRATLDRVAARLRGSAKTRLPGASAKRTALLAGILRCAVCGSPMRAHYTSKASRQYGSYVCTKAILQGADACPGSRAPEIQLDALVVERIRCIGVDADLVAATCAAASADRVGRRQELEASLVHMKAEAGRLEDERQHLVESIARGTQGLDERLSQTNVLASQAAEQTQVARVELLALRGKPVDEARLRGALADFDPVWTELFPEERARVLRLLVESIRFDGRTSDVRIDFRRSGVASLGGAA